MRSGGHSLVQQLLAEETGTVFTVPGESVLPALDALADAYAMRTVVCRQVVAATMIAEATGRITGRPGVALVAGRERLVDAAPALHLAQRAATPLVLLLGLPPRAPPYAADATPLDLAAAAAGAAKWTAIATDARSVPDVVHRGFDVAASGRPGPVVIGLPEDALCALSDALPRAPTPPVRAAPAPWQMERLAELLAAAERPLLLVGTTGWSRAIAQRIEAFAVRFDMPVIAAYQARDAIDNRRPSYVGHTGIERDPKLSLALRAADLVIACGTDLDAVTSGAGTPWRQSQQQALVHVYPDACTIAARGMANLGIAATADEFSAALAALEPPAPVPWSTWRRDLRAACDAYTAPQTTGAALDLAAAYTIVSSLLPEDTILASGIGDSAVALARHVGCKRFGTVLAPLADQMGYALPAAIAAKIENPERTVLAVAGDACFQTTAAELATAAQLGLAIGIVVVDNRRMGALQRQQLRRYPGRVMATSLVNPDFAALARSYGFAAETVTRTSQVAPALERALESSKTYLMHWVLDEAGPLPSS